MKPISRYHRAMLNSKSMRTMKILAFLLLLATCMATSARASDPLRDSLSASDWKAGSAACEQLAENETRRPDRRQLAAAQYAERAALCAAIASGAGEEADAAWWWFTAVAMDAKHALGLLPELRGRKLLLELPPPRTLVPGANRKFEKAEVLLPSGEVVAGEPAKVSFHPETPKHMFRAVPGVASTEVAVEVLVDAEGRPAQPLLVSAKALPLHALQAFDFIRHWRFTPARVKGQAVASVQRLAITTSAMGSSR
jgi:hypothetical protein